ncbi:MAG: hypothetical protein ABIN57_01560 [Chitinophagaceae bacterium]
MLRRSATVSNLVILFFSFVSYPLHSWWIVSLLGFNHLLILCIGSKKLVSVPILSAVIATILLVTKLNSIDLAKQVWEEAQTIPIVEIQTKQQLYKKSYEELQQNPYFLKDYAQFLVNEQLADSAIYLLNSKKGNMDQYERNLLIGDVYNNKGEFKNAIIFYQNVHFNIPNRFIPLYQVMLLKWKLKDTVAVMQYAQQISTMPIKVPSLRITYIKEKAKEIIEGKVISL